MGTDRTGRKIEKYEYESRKVTSKKRCLTFEKIKIYPDYHQVILDEKEFTLTGKEFQILLLLTENRGQVFSKKRIYETIWKGYHQKSKVQNKHSILFCTFFILNDILDK